MTMNPFLRIGQDLRREWQARGHYPPGPKWPSVHNTYGIVRDPLPILLDLLRALWARSSPSGSSTAARSGCSAPRPTTTCSYPTPQNFVWRDGRFGELIPLLGDGLLTIDGDYHDRARRIMMPAFHREQIAASSATMVGRDRGGDRRVAAAGR